MPPDWLCALGVVVRFNVHNSIAETGLKTLAVSTSLQRFSVAHS